MAHHNIKFSDFNSRQAGYSLLELMLAMAVGGIIIAGTYAANIIVAKQYERLRSYSEVMDMGIPSLEFIIRDLRMAGYTALDASLESTYGSITTPITITDSGNACCDSIAIIYDTDTTNRNRYTYYTATRLPNTPTSAATPARRALYLDVENWDGASWTTTTSNALVADYIEDLQFVGSDLDTNGNPRIVDVFMMFRGKSTLPQAVNYTKPDETEGNYDYDITDKFNRDEFSATINIKNLR